MGSSYHSLLKLQSSWSDRFAVAVLMLLDDVSSVGAPCKVLTDLRIGRLALDSPYFVETPTFASASLRQEVCEQVNKYSNGVECTNAISMKLSRPPSNPRDSQKR